MSGTRPARVLLFVYGTLRLDGSPPRRLRDLLGPDVRSLGAATVAGRLHDLGAYPAAVRARGRGLRVIGELLEIDAARLPAIDAYEGFDPRAPARGPYVRERCLARMREASAPRVRRCWIYRWRDGAPPGPALPSGDWLRRPRD